MNEKDDTRRSEGPDTASEELSFADLLNDTDDAETVEADPLLPTQTNVEREAFIKKLAATVRESMSEDIEFVRGRISQISTAVARWGLLSAVNVLDPDILLFPVPVWDEDQQELLMDVWPFSIVLDGNCQSLLAGLQKVTCFTNDQGDLDQQLGTDFKSRVNLIKALAVFYDDMTQIGGECVEERLPVNYQSASVMMQRFRFRIPGDKPPIVYNYENRTVVVDDLKLLEFQARLRWYFEQKAKARHGEVEAKSAIRKVLLSGNVIQDVNKLNI